MGDFEGKPSDWMTHVYICNRVLLNYHTSVAKLSIVVMLLVQRFISTIGVTTAVLKYISSLLFSISKTQQNFLRNTCSVQFVVRDICVTPHKESQDCNFGTFGTKNQLDKFQSVYENIFTH